MSGSVATGKVRLAIARMVAKYPLHAGILARWRLEEDAASATMSIGFDAVKKRMRLRFSPGFVSGISMDELVGVLHHEVNHVLFGHVFHVPEPGEDGDARTAAEEVTVNEWVREPFARQAGAALGLTVPSRERGHGNAVPAATGKVESSSMPQNHRQRAEILRHTEAARAVSESDIAWAWGTLTEAQRVLVPDGLAEVAVETALGAGVVTGDSTSSLGGGSATVSWRAELRRHVGRAMARRPVFGRPPRRYPHLAGIVPGQARRRLRPVVLAAVDTSGSLTDAMLADISAELEVMARNFDVTVVECDTVIHAVYRYSEPITAVHGRGGTDLRPPLETGFLRRHGADLVVYFTDGEGPGPETPPSVPVVWCLTETGTNRTRLGPGGEDAEQVAQGYLQHRRSLE
jgi:hypothetical protein